MTLCTIGLLGGCILPVSTGAPMPATTVGQGRFGFAFVAEAPVLDLIADEDNASAPKDSAIAYGAAPAAGLNVSLSYGLGDDTDLELNGEGALYYFILPLPTGGSIGLRHHFDAGEDLDFALAARVGRIGSTDESTDSSGNKVETGAAATYGAFQAALQYKHGVMRPLLALQLMPASIDRKFSNDPNYTYKGFASSLTFGLLFTSRRAVIGPYVTGTNFYSDRFDNSGWFVSGGVVIAVRPDRNRKPDPVYPEAFGGPPPSPYPYAPPPPQPSPYGPPSQPYPPPQQPVAPPPAPTPQPPPQPAPQPGAPGPAEPPAPVQPPP